MYKNVQCLNRAFEEAKTEVRHGLSNDLIMFRLNIVLLYSVSYTEIGRSPIMHEPKLKYIFKKYWNYFSQKMSMYLHLIQAAETTTTLCNKRRRSRNYSVNAFLIVGKMCIILIFVTFNIYKEKNKDKFFSHRFFIFVLGSVIKSLTSQLFLTNIYFCIDN